MTHLTSTETFFKFEKTDAEDINTETMSREILDSKQLQKDTFVLIQIICEKKTALKLYVGQILEVLSTIEFKVKFLRHTFPSGRSNHFPNIEDVDNVLLQNVVRVLFPISNNTTARQRQQRYYNFGIDMAKNVY